VVKKEVSMQQLNRRDFLRMSAILAGSAALTTVVGCASSADAVSATRPVNPVPVQFLHGVASGDATADALILWTRATPPAGFTGTLQLLVEVSPVADFSRERQSALVTTSAASDFCCKVDFTGLQSGRTYFYRFSDSRNSSVIGRSRTLPVGPLASARFAVVSCSNFPAGYFHVYDALAKQELDAVIHLGDYIYEYPHDGYATEHAKALGRSFAEDNQGEIIQLDDYRKRYARYRTDVALQAVHQQHLFLLVWDDHEICNDAWMHGAENHGADEGAFDARKLAALQAYFEWMPIRPRVQQGEPLYRAVQYGDLARILLLDSRVIGREAPADWAQATDNQQRELMLNRVYAANRQLLGTTQQGWLQTQFQQVAQQGCWAVLAQQVLMSRMALPAEILTGLATPGPAMLTQLREYAALKQQAAAQLPLTEAQQQRLAQPLLPYNLDAWDGYPAAREAVYQAAAGLTKPLIVLAGDTHNAWTSSLRDASGRAVGVELATASVSSPGIETYLQLSDAEVREMATLLPQLITELDQCDLQQRGYLLIELTAAQTKAQWWFVSDILQAVYQQHLGFERIVAASN